MTPLQNLLVVYAKVEEILEQAEKVLPEEVKQQLKTEWEENVTAKLGFKEMRQVWKSERGH